ncbi:sorting nexin-4 [Silurus meridionalis]|nr:sorting nexin-4 [Silurus meridionalis]
MKVWFLLFLLLPLCLTTAQFKIECYGEDFLMVRNMVLHCSSKVQQACYTRYSRLKALNATFRVKNPDKRFADMKHYGDELQSVISQLLRVRARVADRLYGVYKVHGNYGRVFSEWSAIEREMGDGLQSAGHHMDAYAASVDDILEEEEHYADQLKEYLFYTEALSRVSVSQCIAEVVKNTLRKENKNRSLDHILTRIVT